MNTFNNIFLQIIYVGLIVGVSPQLYCISNSDMNNVNMLKSLNLKLINLSERVKSPKRLPNVAPIQKVNKPTVVVPVTPVIKAPPELVIVDAYASWCGPCKKMAPIFYELEREFSAKYPSKYIFKKNNIQESNDYGVNALPTFIFLKDNQVIEKVVGMRSKDVLRSEILKYLA